MVIEPNDDLDATANDSSSLSPHGQQGQTSSDNHHNDPHDSSSTSQTSVVIEPLPKKKITRQTSPGTLALDPPPHSISISDPAAASSQDTKHVINTPLNNPAFSSPSAVNDSLSSSSSSSSSKTSMQQEQHIPEEEPELDFFSDLGMAPVLETKNVEVKRVPRRTHSVSSAQSALGNSGNNNSGRNSNNPSGHRTGTSQPGSTKKAGGSSHGEQNTQKTHHSRFDMDLNDDTDMGSMGGYGNVLDMSLGMGVDEDDEPRGDPLDDFSVDLDIGDIGSVLGEEEYDLDVVKPVLEHEESVTQPVAVQKKKQKRVKKQKKSKLNVVTLDE